MKQLKFKLFITISLTLFLFSCTQKQEVKEVQKPNIIIFFSDDMRPVAVSQYGRTQPTPTIDKLADEGALFSNAYCSSAMCTLSRYTLMTGNFAGRCQAEDFLESNPKDCNYSNGITHRKESTARAAKTGYSSMSKSSSSSISSSIF